MLEQNEAQTPNEVEAIATYDHTATYDVEDDKLRIYYAYRLPEDQYQQLKTLGFQYAPKQECFFAVWTPEREDMCLAMSETIEPEGSTLASRAEAKAQRLESHADNATKKAQMHHSAANRIAERFADGQPILVGHHSERKARRDQQKMQSNMARSVKFSEMVNYYEYKAKGALAHASRKNNGVTRANRIKTLLADLRAIQRSINDAYTHKASWEAMIARKDEPDFTENVTYLSGHHGLSPRGIYSQLYQGIVTAMEVVENSIQMHSNTINRPQKYRWISHLLNRIGFETSQLGGATRFSGELTPVILQAFLREQGADSPKVSKTTDGFLAVSGCPLPAHINADLSKTLELDAEDWLDLMQGTGHTVLVKERKVNPNKKTLPPLINPTKEDAERLQALWNARQVERAKASQWAGTPVPREVESMSSEVYKRVSAGTYSKYSVKTLSECGHIVENIWQGGVYKPNFEAFCRIRVSSRNWNSYSPHSVVHIEDAAAKPLGLDWSEGGV